METTASSTGAALSRDEWCVEVRIKPATFDNILPEFQPYSVKIGGRRIVTESPKDWLARMAELGGKIPTKRQKAPA